MCCTVMTPLDRQKVLRVMPASRRDNSQHKKDGCAAARRKSAATRTMAFLKAAVIVVCDMCILLLTDGRIMYVYLVGLKNVETL